MVMEGVKGEVVVSNDDVSGGYVEMCSRAGVCLDRNFSRAERP